MIEIVSQNSHLVDTCREILEELGQQDLLLDPHSTDPSSGTPEIAIWDWSPEFNEMAISPVPAETRVLYLVERGQKVPNLPATAIGVLTKPVSRAALKLALEQAICRPQAATGFRTDPAERDELLQCLLQAYLRLQEYDYDRTNFLARALHDFRAPLTAIGGYCGLFLEGMLGDLSPAQKDVVYRMQRSAHRLSRMSVAMFDLTLNERARERLVLRPDSIENCIEQAIHEIRPCTEEKDISISLRLRDACAELCFDAAQVEQALVNLLDNACRFTPRHGVIEVVGYPYFCERRTRRTQVPEFERRVRQQRNPNTFRVDIKDNGPAVPPEALPLIFDEYIPHSSPNDRSGGGLGLAVSKLIVRAHQGQVWARSGPEGVVFSFTLPFTAAVPPADSETNEQLTFLVDVSD